MAGIKDNASIAVESVIHQALQWIDRMMVHQLSAKDSREHQDQLFSAETLRLIEENKKLSAALQVEIDKLRNEK